MERRRDVPGLVKALAFKSRSEVGQATAQEQDRVKSARVRWEAALALGRIGDARAVEPLVVALRDTAYCVRTLTGGTRVKLDQFVCVAAARALGEIGDVRSVAALIDALVVALDTGRTVINKGAIEALGKVGDLRAVGPLIEKLRSRTQEWRTAAAAALDSMSWRPDRDEIGATYWIASKQCGRCAEIGAPAIKPLIQSFDLLDNADEAENALAAIGVTAIEPLICTLKRGGWEAAKAAANALAKIGAPAAEPLIAALEGHPRRMTPQAAKALGKIGDPRAIAVLVKATECESLLDSAAEAALEALAAIGAPAIGSLISILENPNNNHRWHAAAALGKTGDARAVERTLALLVDAVQNTSRSLRDRQAAAEALVNMYHSTRLHEAHRSLILAQRERIVEPVHTEVTVIHPEPYEDTRVHEKEVGIGVKFPPIPAGAKVYVDPDHNFLQMFFTSALTTVHAPLQVMTKREQAEYIIELGKDPSVAGTWFVDNYRADKDASIIITRVSDGAVMWGHSAYKFFGGMRRPPEDVATELARHLKWAIAPERHF